MPPESPAPGIPRALGTMVAYGFARGHLSADLALAGRIGASCLEILPDWRTMPDPAALRKQTEDAGLIVHSAHGCWGGQSIRADRVDLGNPDATAAQASLDDLKRCVDWLAAAGGTCLVVHPGGLSDPEDLPARRDALAAGLLALAEHASGTPVVICVENMPPGVHPGSQMADLAALLVTLGREGLALAVDTGHANMNASASAAAETVAAGKHLRTTHVHDNNGQSDTHLPPGHGTIDWPAWQLALDAIDYRGPVMLECIRHLREHPERINEELLALLGRLASAERSW